MMQKTGWRTMVLLLFGGLMIVSCSGSKNGGPSDGLEKKDYTVILDTVIDNHTGFVWQRVDEESKTWADAKDYCANLKLDGFTDWRLPTIDELKFLIEDCSSGTNACGVDDDCLTMNCWSAACYCMPGQGPGENGYYWKAGVWADLQNIRDSIFWSSSSLEGNETRAWYVIFNNGSIDHGSKAGQNRVRCVR